MQGTAPIQILQVLNTVHCSSLSLRRQFLVAVTLDLQSFFPVCLKRGWPSLVNWLHHQTKQYMRWATCLYYPILTNEICVMGTSLAYTLCGFCEMFSSVKMTNAHLWNVWAFPVLREAIAREKWSFFEHCSKGLWPPPLLFEHLSYFAGGVF